MVCASPQAAVRPGSHSRRGRVFVVCMLEARARGDATGPGRPEATTSDAESAELHFRDVLGNFATGVCLITGYCEGGPAGLTVGSFMSVSLHPRLIAICPGVESTSWPAIRETGRFCVNILSEHQHELGRAFAASGGDKFSGLPWRGAPSGSPIIGDVLAWIDCEIETEQPAGDHYLVLGRVLDLDIESEERPLLFHRGDFERIHAPTPVEGDVAERPDG